MHTLPGIGPQPRIAALMSWMRGGRHALLLMVVPLVLTVLGCSPKTQQVHFSAEELARERAPQESSRVQAPRALIFKRQPAEVTKGSAGRGRSDDVPPVSCTTYCADLETACTQEHRVYATMEDCLGTCRRSNWIAGERGGAPSDSLACRYHWAQAASKNARRCLDAGPVSPACLGTPASSAVSVPAYDRSSLCVMGLYDSTDQPSWNAGHYCRDTILSRRVMPTVAHMGYVLRLHDVSKGVPGPEAMRDCRAIITAFYDGSMLHAERYVAWLAAHAKAGRRVVVINDFGAYQDANTRRWLPYAVVNDALAVLGVRYDGQWTDQPEHLEIGSLDDEMFQRRPNISAQPNYLRFRPSRKDLRVYLELNRTDLNDGASAVVFTSPGGGMVMTRYYETSNGDEVLLLSRFLREALTSKAP